MHPVNLGIDDKAEMAHAKTKQAPLLVWSLAQGIREVTWGLIMNSTRATLIQDVREPRLLVRLLLVNEKYETVIRAIGSKKDTQVSNVDCLYLSHFIVAKGFKYFQYVKFFNCI